MASERAFIFLDGSYRCQRLIEDLYSNPTELTEIQVYLPREPSMDELLGFCRCMTNRTTVNELSLCLGLDCSLSTEKAQVLGSALCGTSSLSILDRSKNARNPALGESFWSSLADAAMDFIAGTGFDGSVAACMMKHLSKAKIATLILRACTLDDKGTNGIVETLGLRISFIQNLVLKDCDVDEGNKILIARALAGNSTLESFAMHDKQSVASAIVFGKALTENETLCFVIFEGCSNDALEILTDGLSGSTTLRGAVLSNEDMNRDNVSQTRANLICKLNRAGRGLLRQDVSRLQGCTVEEYWMIMLETNLNDLNMVFSLIRDYPDIFQRFVKSSHLIKHLKKVWLEEKKEMAILN